jgi:4-hydroxybenzoate polyprenyltransferase
MRIAAVIFILLSVGANFYFNNLTSLVVAMFSFPVLLWLLLKRRKRVWKANPDPTLHHPEKTDLPIR